MRDHDANPYTPDELRVVEYLGRIIPEAGAGDDPIGFLMASHETIVLQRRGLIPPSLPRQPRGIP